MRFGPSARRILSLVLTVAMGFAAPAIAEAGPRDGGATDARRPRPLVGINVSPPTASSTNWVFGDLLQQAEFIDGAWRAFTGAAERGAEYPRDGFIIEPTTGARVTDTGNGLVIEAPADARDRGIHVWLPGASPERLFHPTYIDRLKPFGLLRFADWMAVNESDAPDLRRLAVSILLCNAVDSSPWYSMGGDWSDEDVRRVAQMVKRGLTVDRPVYLEWSSEPWKARAGEDRESFIAAWAEAARRDFDIWRDVFSDDPQRVIRVIAGPSNDAAVMEALTSKLGSDGFDAIACDASVSLTSHSAPVQHLMRSDSVDQEALLDLLQQRIDASGALYQRYAEVAGQYEAPLLAYGGGQFVGLSDSRWRDVGLAAQRHPQMYPLYLRHAQQWLGAQRAAGLSGDLIRRTAVIYAHDISAADAAGVTGHLEYQDQPLARAPKYRAILDLARDPQLAARSSTRTPEGWTPAPAGSGWTVLTPSPDSRIIYVSSSAGSDRNDGLSPQTALRTPNEGYERLRDGHPDWLLLRRGDAFSLSVDVNNSFRRWWKSGRSKIEPMVVGAYGDPEKPRPVLLTNGKGFMHPGRGATRPVEHLVLTDLHALANHRAPGHPNFVGGDSEEMGFVIRVSAHDIRLEGLLIEYFWQNVLVSGVSSHGAPQDVSDVRFYRCAVRYAWTSRSSHCQGFSANRFRGLQLIENMFDHNGWLPGHPEQRTVFRHQAYLYEMRDVVIEGNVFSRESFLALKVRADAAMSSGNIVIRNNLFVDNFLPIEVGGDRASGNREAILHTGVTIDNNVLTRVGGSLGKTEFGVGMHITQADEVHVERNLLVHHVPSTRDGYWPGVYIGDKLPSGSIVVRGNVFHDWPDPARVEMIHGPAQTQDNLVGVSDDRYVDATRSIDTYTQLLGGGDRPLLDRIIEQRKHHWNAALTAPVINDWFREGFTLR